MNLRDIIECPTSIGNTHESVTQSYQILQKVKRMLNSGDSHETIIEIIYYIETESALRIKK